ncbi:MAG: AbrB family transcriptional regulator [Alphaproteobacteria bacterium]|nr:AbrB family transcriptional regulator [Alphaproteobacteria bacterium]
MTAATGEPDLGIYIQRVLLALAIGAVGGAIFHQLDMPLAWMIGAMVATTFAALGGVKVAMPIPLRSFMVAVLGVMLGSAFTPNILGRVSEWGVTLAALFLYSVTVGSICFVLFLKIGRCDRVTAYFAAAPGGLTEMTVVGHALGGDERVISLVHTLRVLLIVLTIPFWFRALDGYDAAKRTVSEISILATPLSELALLAVIGLAGALAARLVRLPAPYLTGPIFSSAAAHLTGISDFRPPHELVAVAQVVVGAGIGCRFAGLHVRKVLHTLGLATCATAIMLAGTVAFSLLLHGTVDIPIPALVLAFALGGLAEMSLVALALGADAAFVSTHHIMRIVFVVVIAPWVFQMMERRRAARGGMAT